MSEDVTQEDLDLYDALCCVERSTGKDEYLQLIARHRLAAAKEMQEACAKEAEDVPEPDPDSDDRWMHGYNAGCSDAATAIRAKLGGEHG